MGQLLLCDVKSAVLLHVVTQNYESIIFANCNKILRVTIQLVLRETGEGVTLKKLDYYFLKAFFFNHQVNLANHLFLG